MTNAAAPPSQAPVDNRWSGSQWLRSKDRELLVTKRSVRAAIVTPLVFAIAHGFFSNPQVGLFGAFGSFALLLLVEFPGPLKTRLVSYVALFAVGAFFTVVGTLASTDKVTAVLLMAVVGFAALFAGIIAPQVAAASTAALLMFVLPVAVMQPASAIGPRLLGWTLAGIFSITACLLIWPPPWHDELRRRLSASASALSTLADARASGLPDAAAHADVTSELSLLRKQFASTPYPPVGSASGAIALSKLVGRIEWVAGNSGMRSGQTTRGLDRAITKAVADTLEKTASLICDGAGHPVSDPSLIRAVQDATERLDRLVKAELDADVTMLIGESTESGAEDADASQGDHSLAARLDPGFQTRALAIATEMVSDAALEAAGARDVPDRRLGLAETAHQYPHPLLHRLASYLSFRSVWFRNAVRGAAGLALAVAIVEIINVQHGFWVVLGTLSVLRSNAVGTGASALRAVGGTAIGFLVGAALMVGIADHSVLLWIILPVAVLVSGMAASIISFVAGQAAFTVVVVILFNIIQPTGWKVGLTRIEDVAIGCGVSIFVGLLFWPRGATAALGRALSDAYAASSGYLADAVDRLTNTTQHIDTEPAQRMSQRAYLLLDDAYRQFFAERGAKVVPIETIARLFTGSNRLRLAAYTLSTLPLHPPNPGALEIPSVAIAEAVLRDRYASSHRWFQEFGEFLAARREFLAGPPSHDEPLHEALRRAFDDVRAQRRVDRVQTTLQMLWADEVLESQSQMQRDLAASADLFVRERRGVLI
jgi:uncharacterized membrane protein YccC